MDTVEGKRLALRSASSTAVNKLVVPKRCNKAKYLDRAFCMAGPVLWNALPHELRAVESAGAFRSGLFASKMLQLNSALAVIFVYIYKHCI